MAGVCADASAIDRLAPPVARWFRATYKDLTPAQAKAVPAILDGRSILLSSPTGSGKTLAAFLGVLSGLHALAAEGRLEPRTYCVYVSPLKALAHDMARNLQAPLSGIAGALVAEGRAPPEIRVSIRTGDTPRAERARQRRDAPHVLVTTPESLAHVLAAAASRAALEGLRWVVVDEIHALAETKRGSQLALALERLEALATRDGAPPPVRIGLSATVAPLPDVAAFLTGGRDCLIEELHAEGEPDLRVALPLDAPHRATDAEAEEAVLRALDGILAQSRTTLVFTNTRRSAERYASLLDARHGHLAEDPDESGHSLDPEHAAPERVPFVAPHHGSMSREARLLVEERLKRAQMRCVVTSSSLELGVHLESVDHVVLLGSPRNAARTLQRVGRSGHHHGGTSRATLLVTDPGELPEAWALAELARARRVEEVRSPRAPLDVLAQHLLALGLHGSQDADAAFALTRRASPYAELARMDFDAVLDHLARERLVERHGPTFTASSARARLVHSTHGGTIPESGLLRVLCGERYVGEVEEAFAESMRPGDAFLLAGSAWRFLRATPARVLVAEARGASVTVPGWKSEGLSLSPLLAERLTQTLERPSTAEPTHCSANHGQGFPLSHLEQFRGLQSEFGALPQPGEALVEAFPDDEGRRAVVLHSVLGRRANEALALVLAERLRMELDASIRPVVADTGLALLAPRSYKPSARRLMRLFERPLDEDIHRLIAGHELLRRRFRQVATRGLLLLRRENESLAQRQMRANQLLARLQREDPEHPLLKETWREALHDALDAPAAEAYRAAVATGKIVLRLAPERPCASPLAARILAGHESRREKLRDSHERVEEWLEAQKLEPRRGKGFQGA